MEALLVTRLFTQKTINYSASAAHSKETQYNQFVNDNRNRDRHYSASQSEDIPGMYDYTIVHNQKKGDRPWYASSCLLGLIDLIVAGWVQRMYLIWRTPECFYDIKKYVIA